MSSECMLDYMSSNDYIYVVFSHFVMKLVTSQHFVRFHYKYGLIGDQLLTLFFVEFGFSNLIGQVFWNILHLLNFISHFASFKHVIIWGPTGDI